MHFSKSSLNVFLVTDYFRYNDKLKMKVDVMIFLFKYLQSSDQNNRTPFRNFRKTLYFSTTKVPLSRIQPNALNFRKQL